MFLRDTMHARGKVRERERQRASMFLHVTMQARGKEAERGRERASMVMNVTMHARGKEREREGEGDRAREGRERERARERESWVCTYPFAHTATPVLTFFPHFFFFFEGHPPIRSTKGSGKRKGNQILIIIFCPEKQRKAIHSSCQALLPLLRAPLPDCRRFFSFFYFFYYAARASISCTIPNASAGPI